jgi:leader peptidase (prepilin peptidase)/N-methyltransferase
MTTADQETELMAHGLAATETTDVMPNPAGGTRVARPPLSVRGQTCAAVLAVVAVAASFLVGPATVPAPLAAFAGAALVLVAMFDIDQRIVPNRIGLPATAVVLVTRALIAPGDVAQYAVAALAATSFLAVPRLLSRSAVGMGDVKLARLIGVTLGWGVATAVALSFFCLFPVAVVTMVRAGLAARKAALPMAPFLTAGALLVMLMPALTH